VIGYMLDTNICVALMRGRSARALDRLWQHRTDLIAISIITLAELEFGVAKSARPSYNASHLAAFISPLAILSFDALAAGIYGTVRMGLEQVGMPIGPLDTLIAAHALSLRMTLITNNEREFSRVAGLQIENWLTT
jgi:tRNA(fMet)-specific endonuclease VapC